MAETPKQEAKRLLADVPEEYVFRVCCDSSTLHNMTQLRDALNTMPADGYAFHANSDKNDFANWVRDILKDEKLANDLRKVPSQAQAAKLVADRVFVLRKRLS